MCENKSRNKMAKNKPKKTKYRCQQWKEMDCDEPIWRTPSDVKWKNTTHPVDRTVNWCTTHPMDRTVNWCIGGCWFTLAIFRHVELRLPLAMAGRHDSPAWNTDLIWKRHAWGTLQCGLWMRSVVAARSLLMLIFKRDFRWCWRGDDSGVEQCAFSMS